MPITIGASRVDNYYDAEKCMIRQKSFIVVHLQVVLLGAASPICLQLEAKSVIL